MVSTSALMHVVLLDAAALTCMSANWRMRSQEVIALIMMAHARVSQRLGEEVDMVWLEKMIRILLRIRS
jgi:hypothetical protein